MNMLPLTLYRAHIHDPVALVKSYASHNPGAIVCKGGPTYEDYRRAENYKAQQCHRRKHPKARKNRRHPKLKGLDAQTYHRLWMRQYRKRKHKP